MAVQETAASLINFPMSPRPTGGEGGGQQQESKVDVTSKLVDKIKDYLKEARYYLKLRRTRRPTPSSRCPDIDPKYEALAPVLDGSLPVIISVEKDKDIELAIKFVQDEKLKAIFRGCGQGFKVADKIKRVRDPGHHRFPLCRPFGPRGRLRRPLAECRGTRQGGRHDLLLLGR